MRVLAVTGNASLVVALGSMMRDWEVMTARNADEALDVVQGAIVALIDLSDTSSGLEVADQLYRRGVTIPCVIIGDTIADHPRASILVRPFSLEDLGTAVKESAERGSGPAAAPTRPAPEPPMEEPTSVAPPAPADRPAGRNAAGSPAAAAAPTTLPEADKQPAPGRRGSLTVVRPEPEAVEEEAVETVEEPSADATPSQEIIEETTEPAPTTADIMRSRLEELAAPAAPPPAEPAPPAHSPPPEGTVPSAPAARFEVPPSEAEPQPAARWRRKRRSQPAQTPDETEPPLVRRLKAAAGWAREIEELLAELPVLEDLWEMADALAGELESQFTAQVAAVFALGEDGYQAVAHRGLSRVEAGMVVPDTQPLFSDVIRTQEGILIQPVDLAQGLVAGIGGARTEAMMAAPVVSDGACIAIVVVGGERFAETDLDRLSDLANEAAPGFAVARLLQRLSGRSLS